MDSQGILPSSEQVLIIDDEVLVAAFLADVVEDFGLRVLGPVTSSDAALGAARAERPDIAIVDVSLGASSGIELAAQLRKDYGTAIIFLSGHADLAADPAVQALEPVAVLSKPCLPSDIEDALRAARG